MLINLIDFNPIHSINPKITDKSGATLRVNKPLGMNPLSHFIQQFEHEELDPRLLLDPQPINIQRSQTPARLLACPIIRATIQRQQIHKSPKPLHAHSPQDTPLQIAITYPAVIQTLRCKLGLDWVPHFRQFNYK